MKNISRATILFILAVFFSLQSFAIALPVNYGINVFESNIGARAAGLGGASSYISDEKDPVISNPACLQNAEGIALSFRDSKNLSIFQIFSFNSSTMALGLVTKNESNLQIGGISNSYSNNYAALSYTREIPYATLGVSAKYFLFEQFNQGASTKTGTGWDADIGVQTSPYNWLKLGVLVQNFMPKDFLGGGSNNWSTGLSEGIPAIYRLGTGIKMFGEDSIFTNFDLWKTTIGLEAEKVSDASVPVMFHAGCEINASDDLKFRLGMDQQMRDNAVESMFTFGIGMNLNNWSLNAAYAPNLSGNNTVLSTYYNQKVKAAETPAIQLKSIKVEFPPDNFITDEAIVNVKGETEGLSIKINGLEAYVDQANKFDVQVPLYVGKNMIEISGIYNGQKTSAAIRKVLRKTKVIFSGQTQPLIKEKVESLATLGVIETSTDKEYNADEKITRAEFAMWLIKAKNLAVPGLSKDPFPDVKIGTVQAPYISAVVSRGLMSPDPDGNFRPYDGLDQSEAANILKKFDELK